MLNLPLMLEIKLKNCNLMLGYKNSIGHLEYQAQLWLKSPEAPVTLL